MIQDANATSRNNTNSPSPIRKGKGGPEGSTRGCPWLRSRPTETDTTVKSASRIARKIKMRQPERRPRSLQNTRLSFDGGPGGAVSRSMVLLAADAGEYQEL